MRLSSLTVLAFELNHALDLGRQDRISIAETIEHIERGDVFTWLPGALDVQFDFSLHMSNGADKEIVEAWRSLANAIDHQRKFGVKYSGLSLLLAYTIELIQQKVWDASEI